MLKKSTSSAKWSSIMTAEGTSTIMPTFICAVVGLAFFLEVFAGFAEHHLGLLELEQRAHEREHDADVAGRARAKDRPQLRAEQSGFLSARRMLRRPRNGLASSSGKGMPGQFVGAEVDRAHDDGLTAHGAGDCGVGGESALLRSARSSPERKRNSVRYRPMPSAPRFWHCSTSYGNSMLPRSWMRTLSRRFGGQIAELFEL